MPRRLTPAARKRPEPPPPLDAELLIRVRALLDTLRRSWSLGGVFFRFDDVHPPVADKGLCRLCNGCIRHVRAGGLCRNSAYAAAIQGFAIGDVWYTRCWLGVDCFVVPVAPHGEIVGAFEVGGYFTPGESDQSQDRILARLSILDSKSDLAEFVTALQGMRETEFRQVQDAAETLLRQTCDAGLNQARDFAVRKRIYRLQQQLTGRPPETPAMGGAETSPVLRRLIRLVEEQAVAPARRTRLQLDEFLTAALLAADNDMPRLKGAFLALLGLLAWGRLQQGEEWHAVIGRYEKQLLELEKLGAPEELCMWLEKLLFAPGVLAPVATSPRERRGGLTERVTSWIRQHYPEKVSVGQVARALGVSRSTLVHRLKQESGDTFGELLNVARVHEAKRLLALTDLAIGEISTRCGFHDQSYFTKVFDRHISLTPREFRRLLVRPGQAPDTIRETGRLPSPVRR